MKKRDIGILAVVAILLFSFTRKKKGNSVVVLPLEGNFLGYAKAGAILFDKNGNAIKVYKGGEALKIYTSEFRAGVEYLIVSDDTNSNGIIRASQVNQIQIKQQGLLGSVPYTC